MDEINYRINRFVEFLEKKIDASENKVTLNADEYSLRHVLDIVFKCFYRQDNLINYDAKINPWISLIMEAVNGTVYWVLNMYIIFPSLRPVLGWLIVNFSAQGRIRGFIVEFLKKQTKLNFDARNQMKNAKLEAEKNNRIFDPNNFTLKDGTKFDRNLIDYFVDQFHDGKINESEYFNTGTFLFYAANKTTADSMSLLIYNLAKHQNVQDKLRQSILIDGEKSEYLSWCINESLRLNSPVPASCNRTLAADYTDSEGILIPKGALLMASTYCIHTSTEIWGEDALEFNPNRWSKSADFHPCQFIAFGLGKRDCSGRAFALTEIKMLMNVLLRKFKFEKSSLTSDNIQYEAPFFTFVNYDQQHYIHISKI